MIVKKIKENLTNSWLCRSSWSQSKTERKRKTWWVPRPCKRTEKTLEHESRFGPSGGQQSENEGKREDWQILWPCQRTEKTVEHEGHGDTGSCGCNWKSLKMLGEKRQRGIGYHI